MTADHEVPATFADVATLRRNGDVSAGAFLELVQQSRDATYWHQWAMRALLVLGAAHIFAGVIFFFAYNWDDLAPFAKFGILQSGVLLSFMVALFLGLERPGGQAMLIAASVFTGVLFAVVGQVYQTGADAWELFAAWTILTLPWVLASRSAAHWLFWIVICVVAVSLYGAQVLVALGHIDGYELGTAIAVLPLVFLTVREFALQQGFDCLDGSWFRRSLIAMSVVPLFFLALQYVFDSGSALIGFVAFALASSVLVYVYLKVLPDFFVLAGIVSLASLVAMAIGGRLIFEMLDASDAGTLVLGLFLLGAWCVFVTTAVVRLLTLLHKLLPAGAGDD